MSAEANDNQAAAGKARQSRGRPSKLSKKLARDICERLEAGESLRDICTGPDMPARSTVNRWLADNEEFRDQYTRAREAYNDDEFDRMDELDGLLLRGVIKADVHRSVIDSMKWRIAKRDPKKYSDKVKHELTGADGGPLEIRWARPEEIGPDGGEAGGGG